MADTPEVKPPEVKPETTPPVEAVLFSFSAVHGVMYHPTSSAGGRRVSFNVGQITQHAKDAFTDLCVAAGALKIV